MYNNCILTKSIEFLTSFSIIFIMNADDFLNLAKKYNLFIEDVRGAGTYYIRFQIVVSLTSNSQRAIMALVNDKCVIFDGKGTSYNNIKQAEQGLLKEIISRKKIEITKKLKNIEKDFK